MLKERGKEIILYAIFSFFVSLLYYFKFQIWDIEEMQKSSGEIGGASQAFVSVMLMPMCFLLSVLFVSLVWKPIAVFLLKNQILTLGKAIMIPLIVSFSLVGLFVSLKKIIQEGYSSFELFEVIGSFLSLIPFAITWGIFISIVHMFLGIESLCKRH